MNVEQSALAGFQWDAATIRALRTFMHRSQSAFARELGVRQQTVSEWETGMYRPRGASTTLLTIVARSAGFQADEPANEPAEPSSIPDYYFPTRPHVAAASSPSFPPPAPGNLVDSNSFYTASSTEPPQDSPSPPPRQVTNRAPSTTRGGEIPI